MMIRIVLSSTAKNELEASYLCYEERSAGLGKRFLDVIDQSFQMIKLNPDGFPKKNQEYREFVLKRFPFVIIYQFDKINKMIYVLRIFHSSRNPHKRYKVR